MQIKGNVSFFEEHIQSGVAKCLVG